MNRAERRSLSAVVRGMTGQKVDRITFPGGKSRKSFRLTFTDGTSAIATRRRSDSRREREIDVMSTLSARQAPVPRVLGVQGDLMLQEDLGKTRLSEKLHAMSGDTAAITEALDQAIEAMAQIHEIAAEAGLSTRVPLIGAEPDWIDGLINCPREIEAALGLNIPTYSIESLQHLLRVREPSFVKWDSRPGNALLRDGKAYWFDWEDSGARNALDDLVWLMCDEFVTFKPEMHEELLRRHMPRFACAFDTPDEALDYFAAMAVFHTVVRLSLIVRYKNDGDWWSMSRCLEGDKVGVTLRCTRRLVWRGAFWADRLSFTRPLVAWFRDLEAHFEASQFTTVGDASRSLR